MALSLVNQMQVLIAYCSADERCVFSNHACQEWFGRSAEEMTDITLKEMLGPDLYKRNHPHILRALGGEKQIFERDLTNHAGSTRRHLVTYMPDVRAGMVVGFSVNAAELPVQEPLAELLPICASCKSIQCSSGEWLSFEDYLMRHSPFGFTHGLCPSCMPHFFPNTNQGAA